MPITLEQLENVAFPKENWPEELPMPGEDTISEHGMEDNKTLYRYAATADGRTVAMEVVIDTSLPDLDPAEGVSFMLNQFAYLWRTDRDKLTVSSGGKVRRIHF